jgi:hypothetical protein
MSTDWTITLIATGYMLIGCLVGLIAASYEDEKDEAVVGAVVCLFMWPIVAVGFTLWLVGRGITGLAGHR